MSIILAANTAEMKAFFDKLNKFMLSFRTRIIDFGMFYSLFKLLLKTSRRLLKCFQKISDGKVEIDK